MIFVILAQVGSTLPAIDFDLAKVVADGPACGTAPGGGDIVVCAGRRHDRLTPLDPMATNVMPMADFGLVGQLRGKVQSEQADVGGFASNRVKLTLGVPF
ncbi:hypothetical protein SAMN05444678_103224 [Sphingomonas sp. YR710]|uniref:hypothetical protein n=1 Tax=Sphingomonas sp. YR710 TaxID=1882773 RepID=UPI0008820F2C|nr:hypothetical protein [Sphingomonas sp. YR710]SDC50726.1 hypothetical protein SAMN05444678_103224 [Sphingomonas sp. YR710]